VAQAKGIWAWQHRNFELEGNNGFNANAADREDDYHYDVTVGAPIIGDKLSVMVTNQRERTAYAYDLSKTSYRDNMLQAKVTLTPTATTKLSVGYLRGWADGTKNGDFTGTFVRSQSEAARRFDDVQMFAPGSQNNQETIDRDYYTLNWSHTLSPKTFYNVTARYGRTDWEATWQRAQALGIPAAAVDAQGNITEINESGAASAQASGAVVLDEAPVGWNYTNRRVDILGVYRLRGGGGASRSADWSWIKESDYTFDITSQMTPHHQVKGGIQAHTFNLREYRGYTSTLPDRPEGWESDNPADIIATQTANLHNYRVKTPWYGGFFVQDRMEYRQIVVNAGLRLDFHRPDKWFDLVNEPHDPYIGSNAQRLYERRRSTRAPTKWAWSPRFGVSHPTTATSKLFFNYGHFYQVPTTVELYRAQSGAGEPLENFGNPWVEMPQTIAYELGFEKSIQGTYLASGTVYFKDIDKELEASTAYYTENSTGRRTRWTTQGRIKDVRGYELSFKKSRGKFFTGFISYDFRQERAKRIGWDRIYDQLTVSTPSRLIIEASANSANPSFKARPIWKLGLNFRTPLDYGAGQHLWKGGWEANLFFRREGGWWMGYNPTNDFALQNVLNVQWKDSNMADLRISKAFDTKGAPMLYLEVHNLLNFKNFEHARDFDGEVWDYPGTNDDNKTKAYLARLGWTVDSSGKLQSGSRPGGDFDLNNPGESRRPYLAYL
ncbi:MAG: TonB-dependent receptor, partial [Candidatus Latescibacteria bacterium]|nr:TonB-dependent receptor [Candidatus Latescibacterota bacterium]